MPPKSAPPSITLSDLKPAPYNPRTITHEAVVGLNASLLNFGDIAGVTWNRRTGHLVAGHQRLASLKALHGDKLTVVCLDEERGEIQTPDGQRFTLRIVDWDENREKAANVAANNPYVAGDFEREKLDAMLEEMKAWDEKLFADLRMEELVIEDSEEPSGPPQSAEPQWRIVIDCASELERSERLAILQGQGIPCTPLP